MTTPTPPRDLSERMTAPASPGRSTNARPRGRRAHLTTPSWLEQQPPRWQEAQRRQYSGDRIVSHLRQAAQAHAAKVRLVLSDEQMATT
jgi:hypothetical protein